MEVDDGSKPIDTSFLDYIFNSVCRTRALLFTPFSTSDVLYDGIDQLLQSCGFQYPSTPVFETPVGETERIMVFAEGKGSQELKNLESVLRGLDVDMTHWRCNYSRALFVVVDRVSGVPVNVEHQHCWWASNLYSIGGGREFFMHGPQDFMLNGHQLLKACQACSAGKSKCRRDGVGDCSRCVKLGIDCTAGPMESVARRRDAHKVVKSQLHMLCAIHQYVIVTHGRRLNEQIMAAAQVERLLAHVLAHQMPSWNHDVELSMLGYADSYQCVAIEDGRLSIQQEKEMEAWWGYEQALESMTRDERRALISPHLGMCSPNSAILFIDHALRRPGELFYRDDCILDRAFVPVSVRIMVVAAVISSARIRISLGWKKP